MLRDKESKSESRRAPKPKPPKKRDYSKAWERFKEELDNQVSKAITRKYSDEGKQTIGMFLFLGALGLVSLILFIAWGGK